MYEAEHEGHFISLGHGIPGLAGRMMPDIMDFTLRKIAEIKPDSVYGLATGHVQLQAYLDVANGLSVKYRGRIISPSASVWGGGWKPSTWALGSRHIPIADPAYTVFTIGNVGGVLFYHVFENTKPIPVPKYVLVYVKRRMEELSKAFGRAALEGSVATAMAYSQLMD